MWRGIVEGQPAKDGETEAALLGMRGSGPFGISSKGRRSANAPQPEVFNLVGGGSIRSRYPDCPPGEAEAIAKHACEKDSGRVGRSSAAKSFDATAIDLAVKAHVRHTHTEYDRLLSRGWERSEARSAVLDRVAEIMERWRRA